MKAWAIKDWDKKFTLSQLQRAGIWTRACIPINLAGDHFRILMETPKGREAFGIFIALVEVAANMPIRGVLAKEDGPLNVRSLHNRTGIPEAAIGAAINTLGSHTMADAAGRGWIYEVEWRPEDYRRTEHEPSLLGDRSEHDRSKPGAHPEHAPSMIGASRSRAEQSISVSKSRAEAAPGIRETPARSEPEAGVIRDGSALPACLPLRETLAQCGVGEPSLSAIAGTSLKPEEVAEAWRMIKARGQKAINPVGMLVAWAIKRTGVKIARHGITADIAAANQNLLKLRDQHRRQAQEAHA